MTSGFARSKHLKAAVVALALVLVPAVASAQAKKGGGLEIGGEAGLTLPLSSGVGVGIKAAGQGFFFLPEFSPGLSLGLGGQLAFDIHFADVKFWFLDAVPMARLRYAISPKMAVYGDGGLGLGLVHASTPTINIPGFGNVGGSSTDVAFMLKLGGGVQFKIDEKLSFTAGPAFNIYIKDGSATTLSLMGGLLYKLQ